MDAAATKVRDDLRLLYQVTVADLAFFKSQQWSVSNHTLLVLAALVGIEQLLKPVAYSAERWLFGFLALAAAVACLYILRKLEKSISVRRSRLSVIRESLTRTLQDAWGAEDKGEELITVAKLMYGVVSVSGALACWLLVARL